MLLEPSTYSLKYTAPTVPDPVDDELDADEEATLVDAAVVDAALVDAEVVDAAELDASVDDAVVEVEVDPVEPLFDEVLDPLEAGAPPALDEPPAPSSVA